MNVIAEIVKYYNYELEVLSKTSNLMNVSKNAILSRGLGVAFFAQQLGAGEIAVDTLYNDFKEKVEKLLDTDRQNVIYLIQK